MRSLLPAIAHGISEEVSTAIGSTLTQFAYAGGQMIMEQDSAGNVATYVYGDGIDELIQMRRTPNDYYYYCDDPGPMLALTDSNGLVAERYEYRDYGQPEFYDALGNPIGASAVGNPYLFTGRRYDSTTGLYYFRRRYLDPVAGAVHLPRSGGRIERPGRHR